uniref:Glucose-methanol-choline oxidoreductase C-terminal domain-containing protein n=1 Tax=Hyaloperonospora arabidopsidis (strain Emoy2) TaxID=559515 RepID=M4BWL5_HYAAE
MQAHCSPMRAQSRGWLKLRSSNPRDHPIIEPNYLSVELDLIDMRTGVKLTREILEQQTLDAYRGDPISPSKDVQSDAQIDEWIRQNTESAYHPSCTNRMGVDDNTVVDPQMRVHGLENLRVVDASIMPNIVSGNLNAPTIMIAEKAADIILGKTPLPRSPAPVYEPKNWEGSQR